MRLKAQRFRKSWFVKGSMGRANGAEGGDYICEWILGFSDKTITIRNGKLISEKDTHSSPQD